jgi:hypothetical protein
MDGPVFEAYKYPKETVSATIVQVSVRDSRRGVVTDSFDTPVFSLPGDGEKRPVPITRATADEL